VAEHQGVRLGAVDQADGDAGEGGVEQRALALDQVPVVGVVGRGQPLDGAGDEVGDNRVDRDAVAGDEDAGLAGRSEVGLHAALAHLGLEGERRVHLADRAVGADREQALAGALPAVGDVEVAGRVAHVEELSAEPLGGLAQPRHVVQLLVQARRQVHARLQGLDEHVGPGLGDPAAAVGDADDHRLDAGRLGLGDGHVLQAEIGVAVGQAQLADARRPRSWRRAGPGHRRGTSGRGAGSPWSLALWR
jgi:hypothetical protein